MENKYGISNLKMLISFMGVHAQRFAARDADGDGEVTLTENASFATGLLLQAFAQTAMFTGIIPEAGDLTLDEIKELVEHTLATDFLPDDNDAAEDFVKSILRVLLLLTGGVEHIVKLTKGEADGVYDPFAGLLG